MQKISWMPKDIGRKLHSSHQFWCVLVIPVANVAGPSDASIACIWGLVVAGRISRRCVAATDSQSG
ncbi:hypothetical protein XFF6992_240171 [Xanthomonas citri pv. fuscans]|nr:hypothetical protein XFF6992_240171 [Xanthomonas citri pv. fuscans]SOO32582.1 hypothetical protein XFF6994_1990005 [Xanthomonas citri pv. fuscans]